MVDGIASDGEIQVQTLTEIVAAVVMHSSAAAYSHFGVAVETHQAERPPAAERTVARAHPSKGAPRIVRKPVEEQRPGRGGLASTPHKPHSA